MEMLCANLVIKYVLWIFFISNGIFEHDLVKKKQITFTDFLFSLLVKLVCFFLKKETNLQSSLTMKRRNCIQWSEK